LPNINILLIARYLLVKARFTLGWLYRPTFYVAMQN
jgi:hypothetical protein